MVCLLLFSHYLYQIPSLVSDIALEAQARDTIAPATVLRLLFILTLQLNVRYTSNSTQVTQQKEQQRMIRRRDSRACRVYPVSRACPAGFLVELIAHVLPCACR